MCHEHCALTKQAHYIETLMSLHFCIHLQASMDDIHAEDSGESNGLEDNEPLVAVKEMHGVCIRNMQRDDFLFLA